MMRKIILVAVCFCLLVLPAAGEQTTNGDFETGDFTGWEHSTYPICYIADYDTYFLYFSNGTYVSQNIDFTGVENVTFEALLSATSHLEVYVDSDLIETFDGYAGWSSYSVPVSYSGVHTLKFVSTAANHVRLDDISAISIAGAEPITWNQSTYSAGDIANISYAYPDYSSGFAHYINIRSYNSVSAVWELETQIYSLYESGSIQYLVPNYASRQFKAELMQINSATIGDTGFEIANATMQMTSAGASIAFDSTLFERNDNLTFHYYNMPSDSYIQFHSGPSASGADYFYQFNDISGNGTGGYQLPDSGPSGELFYVRAYDSDGNQIAVDYTYTSNIATGTCTLHGRVRDSDTEAVVSGATISVAGESTTTDSSGDYSLSFSKGTWDIVISKSGYVTKTVSDFTFSGTSYSYNPYLQPNPEASDKLSGTVSDIDTGAGLTSVYITVSNGSVTKSTYSQIGGGWSVSGLADGETYTIKAVAEYYETYYESFTFSSSSNTYSIEMVSKDGGDDEDDDEDDDGGLTDDDDDGGGLSDDDNYRPGRIAARGVLEESEANVPAMFSMLLMIFFIAAAKKGIK
jgi:hypothetical protein